MSMLTKKILAGMQLLVVAAQLYRLYQSFGSKGRLDILSNQEREKFRALKIESAQPHLILDGSTATVVIEQNSGLEGDGFMYTLYARNHAGEYFMYKASGGRQFVKHVPQNIAKVVLKDRYQDSIHR